MKDQRYHGNSASLNCKGELLSRVLGGVGSAADQMAFEMHIESCESCRLSQQLCGDFDRIGAAPDDSARIARIAAAALEQRKLQAVIPFPVPEKRRKPILRWALVALAMGGTAAAAAAMTPWLREEEAAEPIKQSAESKGSELSAAGALKNLSRVPAHDGAETEDAPGQPEASSESMLPQSPTNAVESAAKKNFPSSGVTAESIFREANLARRNNNGALAMTRYRQLQTQFPSSPEANLSRVSLGRLLLQSGSSKAAVNQFDKYLGSGSGQSLAAEALYGRAQALQALGRSSDEAENWRRLLKSYPNSPYSAEARLRLQTLR